MASSKPETRDLRLQAVGLYFLTLPRPDLRALAEEFGISYDSVWRAVRKGEAILDGRVVGLPSEDEELRRLRAENARLKDKVQALSSTLRVYLAAESEPPEPPSG
ncbi:hypothetical protein [Pseudonocardia acidicola]|uniref:Transposase n=1 Tax=Pseudonocardia acidicola TaxID=2724939 RepID=A0ABX1SKD5_9PSEU|nr:hypothetical protein [Pseudonocardia acidicola]NMI02041.1 hypothetical protein [Pseudonocardia acidicola]